MLRSDVAELAKSSDRGVVSLGDPSLPPRPEDSRIQARSEVKMLVDAERVPPAALRVRGRGFNIILSDCGLAFDKS